MAKFQRIYWKKEFDWDNYAKLYDAYAKSNGNYYLLSSLELIKCASLNKKTKIVDLACGTGALTNLIIKKNAQVNILALDLSKEMIKYYKKNFRKQLDSGKIRVCVGNAEKTSKITKDRYDYVFISSALWDLELDPLIKDLDKILKKGGKVIFNLPSLVVERETGFIYFIEHFFRETLKSDLIYRRIPIPLLKAKFNKKGFSLQKMKDYEFNMPKTNVKKFFDVLRYRYPFILFPKEMPYSEKLKRCTDIFNDSLRYVPKEGLDERGVVFVFEKR